MGVAAEFVAARSEVERGSGRPVRAVRAEAVRGGLIRADRDARSHRCRRVPADTVIKTRRSGKVFDARHLCTSSVRKRFAEPFAAANVFAAVFIDGDRRLTDIASRQFFPIQAGKSMASFESDTSRNVGSDACLEPTNRLRS